MAGRPLALVAVTVLGSCGRTGHPSPADAQPSATATVSASDAAVEASRADASAPAPPFSAHAWLEQHGVARFDHEDDCSAALTLSSAPPVDLLVCRRSVEQRGPVPWVTHTILYAAARGHLRAALDVPTDATSDIEHLVAPGASEAENADWLHGNDVHLGVRADGDRVVVFDRGDGGPGTPLDPRYTCQETVSRAGRPGPGGMVYVTASDAALVKQTYRAICDQIGAWRWNGSGLVRETPAPLPTQ